MMSSANASARMLLRGHTWALQSPAALVNGGVLSNSTTTGTGSLQSREKSSYKCVVIGGGAGGSGMAHKMVKRFGKGSVAVVEPQEEHYYQPMFTLVGSGHKTFAQTHQPMGQTLPKGATWVKDKAQSITPEQNLVTTANGVELEYDLLIIACGVQLDYQKIDGALDALDKDSRVCSNYSPKYVGKTFSAFGKFEAGQTGIFTMPPMPIKCAGAPQKILYLFDDYLRRNGKRDGSKLFYNTNLPVIFGVKKYADALLEVAKSRDITVNFQHNLVAVDHTKGEATFAQVGKDPVEKVTMSYDLLHISPPQSAPTFLQQSSGITDAAGFVDVNKGTLVHNKYSNVFALGDCSSLPTAKTAAAVAAEIGVLSASIDAVLAGKTPTRTYNGYTSCPLITKQGKTILAEFDYDAQPLETFPFNQAKERRTMWHLKADVMPFIYWHMLVKGNWHGPGVFRKLFRFGLGK